MAITEVGTKIEMITIEEDIGVVITEEAMTGTLITVEGMTIETTTIVTTEMVITTITLIERRGITEIIEVVIAIITKGTTIG